MNAMLNLALSEGHKKRLPMFTDNTGAGNPICMRKSVDAKAAILRILNMGVHSIYGINEQTGIPKDTIYSNMRRLGEMGRVEKHTKIGQQVFWKLKGAIQ